MRPYSWSARKSARGTACIVACACSIQLTGCLNSTRDLTADVTKNAGQAAIAAEQELAREKLEAAVAASEGNSEPENRLQLAGATTPETASDEEVVAAAEQPKGFSFLNIFRKKSEPVAEDPFLSGKGQVEVAARSADNAASQPVQTAAADLPAVRPASAEAAVPAKSAADHTIPEWARSPELAFDRQPQSTDVVQRSFPEFDQKFKELEPSQELPQVAGSGTSQNSSRKVVGPKPPPDWIDEWLASTAPPKSEPAAPASKDDHRAQLDSLLADTHRHLQSGELAAAYRSALLAEQYAAEHKLTFSSGEVEPRELAREIAARIWEDSNPDQKLAAGQASETREERTKRLAPFGDSQQPPQQLVQNVFPEEDSAPQWMSLPLDAQPRFGVPQTSTHAPETSVQTARLPEVKPVLSREFWNLSSTREMLPNPDDAFAPGKKPTDRTEMATLDEAFGTSQDVPDADGGVKFAIAHTVSEEDGKWFREPLQAPSQSPAQPPLVVKGSLTDSAMDVNAPNLRLPQAHGEPDQLGDELLAYNWEELSRADSEPRKASRSGVGSQRRWGVLSLIAAIFAGLIGLRLTRGRSGQEEEFAETLSVEIEVPEKDNEDRSQLRIKRAA